MKYIYYLILCILLICCNRTNDYYYNLACDEDEKGNIKQAIHYLNKALEINPNDISALNNRGFDYLDLKQFELANADFQKMIDIDPKCPGAFYALGYLNYELKNFEKAIAYFDTVIILKGGGPIFLEHVENDFTESPYSLDVPINKVYHYRNKASEGLKKN